MRGSGTGGEDKSMSWRFDIDLRGVYRLVGEGVREAGL